MVNKLFKLKFEKIGFSDSWDYKNNDYIFYSDDNIIYSIRFRRNNGDFFGFYLKKIKHGK